MNDLINLNSSLQTVGASYCSVKLDSKEAKIAVFNATTNPDNRLSDMVNKTITVTDFYAERTAMVDSETGEVREGVRIILFDKDGITYQTSSTGVFNAIGRMVALFGQPTWEEGIAVIVKQIRRGKGNMLTLNLA